VLSLLIQVEDYPTEERAWFILTMAKAFAYTISAIINSVEE
jgi:hypothetical protein